MKNSESHLKNFYLEDALIRDQFIMEDIIEILESIEGLQFQLDLVSPLLNSWTTSKAHTLLSIEADDNIHSDWTVLFLKGAFSVDMWCSGFSTELSDGDNGLNDHECISCRGFSPTSEEKGIDCISLNQKSTHSSPDQNRYSKSPENALPARETGFVENTEVPSPENKVSPPTGGERSASDSALDVTQVSETSSIASLSALNLSCSSSCSNNLAHQTTWLTVPLVPRKAVTSPASQMRTQTLESSSTTATRLSPNERQLHDWVIVRDDIAMNFPAAHVNRLVDIFPGASCYTMEEGRNSVFHGACQRCDRVLTFGQAHLDYYDAKMYCEMCHQLQKAVIPRDVVYNWNFSQRPVSRTTHLFLMSLHWQPVINLTTVNPSLYAIVPELIVVRQLRRALVLLWHHVSGCSLATASALLRAFDVTSDKTNSHCRRHPKTIRRPYMVKNLNDLDLFSLGDLMQVQTGQLKSKLLFAVNSVALEHVRVCHLCRRRLLLCDVCESQTKPIWPHEYTTYVRCSVPGCARLMHVDCMQQLQELTGSLDQTGSSLPGPPGSAHHTGRLPSLSTPRSTAQQSAADQLARLDSQLQCLHCQLGQGPASFGSLMTGGGHYAEPYFA